MLTEVILAIFYISGAIFYIVFEELLHYNVIGSFALAFFGG